MENSDVIESCCKSNGNGNSNRNRNRNRNRVSNSSNDTRNVEEEKEDEEIEQCFHLQGSNSNRQTKTSATAVESPAAAAAAEVFESCNYNNNSNTNHKTNASQDALLVEENTTTLTQAMSSIRHQHQHQQQFQDEENTNNYNSSKSDNKQNQNQTSNEIITKISIEQERQLLILVLLAQVTALNDWTPNTFHAHLHDLLTKGILDYELIIGSNKSDYNNSPAARIFQQMGLVNSMNYYRYYHEKHTLKMLQQLKNNENNKDQEGDSDALIIPYQQYDTTMHNIFSSSSSSSTALSVKDYPLITSRYKRDFIERQLLASGAFGQVFHVTNKLDHCDYAIKRVIFSTTTATACTNGAGENNNNKSEEYINSVIREIHCLAQLSHENIVRYYTSWLEPSWTLMGGNSGYSNDNNNDTKMKYLMDGSHQSSIGDNNVRNLNRNGHGKTNDQLFEQKITLLGDCDGKNSNSNTNSRYEEGGNDDWDALPTNNSNYSQSSGSSIDSDYSEWTIQQDSSWGHHNDHYQYSHNFDDDEINGNGCYGEPSISQSHVADTGRPAPVAFNQHPPTRHQKMSSSTYSICMNIQMELCEPTTLADWIRSRNEAKQRHSSSPLSSPIVTDYKGYQLSWDIFLQISRGLSHVHSKGIIHRDLKPANILHTSDGRFKIGDFGLSRRIQSINSKKKNSANYDFGNGNRVSNNVHIVPLNSRNNCSYDNHQDPLTSGIGTGSYASPEQLETQTYGPKADIFSLGLILLELFCSFDSAHERASTFRNCRQGLLPDALSCKKSPLYDIGNLILACTKSMSSKRPSADDIVNLDVFSESKIARIREQEMENLESIILSQKQQLEEKDAIIARLKEELHSMKKSV